MQKQMGVVAYSLFVESFWHSVPALFFGVFGDSKVGEYPGRVTEVDWKCTVDCLYAINAQITIEGCVSLSSSTLLLHFCWL